MISQLTEVFQSYFETIPLVAFAPGRINLIGEHTDYQEGFVFPAAVKQGIWVGIQKNSSKTCRLYSMDFDQEYSFDLGFLSPKNGHWATYVMGMVALLKQSGYEVSGFDMVIGGNIPVGAGLSSSAALSVAIGTAISRLFDFKIPKKNIVLYAQKSEHLYAGVKCGIMDPYTSAFGVEGKALLLDCRSNTHQEIAADFGDYALVLVNTKVKHSLADTAYNKRREACEESVRILLNEFPEIKTLRDLSLADLKKVEGFLPKELYPKAKHEITECDRVHQAARALQAKDLAKFGRLLNLSHKSLSEDYEVSCPELDFLAETAQAMHSVLGSRMMGGGFGGCTINLVKESELDIFKDTLRKGYETSFGKTPDFILVEIGEGARIIS
ncbi:galactokinase [Algoriphagus boseongensis]|uniref:Galactokinase n=1 Tax=Algoriphagus boseongensis TaxID=1442587 RepID=A0A4R6T476_9BACT|nr:galactokinase [Algoriphagus boseongensis]TDQ15125.1 galactokinase [Algoriphagus boseongensis]